jgi:hypothetical protein
LFLSGLGHNLGGMACPWSSPKRVCAFLFLLAHLGACGDSKGSGPGRVDAACTDSIGWFEIRRSEPTVFTSATVADGALTMKMRNAPVCVRSDIGCINAVIEIAQSGGAEDTDLEISASFEAFKSGGPGAAAGLQFDFVDGWAFASIRQAETMVLDLFIPRMPRVTLPTTATSGKFTIRYHDSTVTAIAEAGSDRIETTHTRKAVLRASIGVYNHGDAEIADETSVRFTDFRVVGSKDLRSDDFACNHLP